MASYSEPAVVANILLRFWQKLIGEPLESLLKVYCGRPMGSTMNVSRVSLRKAALLIASLPPVEQGTASAVITSLGRFTTPADAIARVVTDRIEDIFRSQRVTTAAFEDARYARKSYVRSTLTVSLLLRTLNSILHADVTSESRFQVELYSRQSSILNMSDLLKAQDPQTTVQSPTSPFPSQHSVSPVSALSDINAQQMQHLPNTSILLSATSAGQVSSSSSSQENDSGFPHDNDSDHDAPCKRRPRSNSGSSVLSVSQSDDGGA
jgi:hypothetical protein